MAPGLTSVQTDNSINFTAIKSQASRSIFPDGIKTSGQHPPNYDELKGYHEFPESVDGPTLWKAEDYRDNPERWVHRFSEDEIEEMSTAADDFKASGTPLTGITKVVPSHGEYQGNRSSRLGRIISPYLASPAFWRLSAMSSSTAKVSLSSKASQSSDGAIKSLRSRTWDSAPI